MRFCFFRHVPERLLCNASSLPAAGRNSGQIALFAKSPGISQRTVTTAKYVKSAAGLRPQRLCYDKNIITHALFVCQ